MGKWTDADTAKHSGDSTSKVAEAEHQAREDATKSGDFERGNNSKSSQRFKDTDGLATSFWDAIFGKK